MPDHGGQSELTLTDAGEEAVVSAGSVSFQRELATIQLYTLLDYRAADVEIRATRCRRDRSAR